MRALFDRRPDGLPPELDGKLRAIIRRVRLLQIARGVCATLAVAVAGTLAVMAVDAALVIDADAVRVALSGCVLALTLATAYVALVRPLSARISTVRMARILETRHPELQERISSAIELLAQGGEGAAAGSRQLLDLLVADARADASALSASGEFRGATLRPVAVAAAAFVAILLLLLLVVPRQASLLLMRAVAPVVPRDNLAARAFAVEPGNLTVVEGETVRFVLVARGGNGERAELCLSRPGEPRAVERMARRFDPDGGKPVFELTMPAVKTSFDYRMRLGRALTRRYRLTVVPPPAVGEFVCSLAPPGYTGQSPTQLVSTAVLPLRAPFGTRADLAVRLNRPARARLLFGAARSLEPAKAGESAEAAFSWTLSTNAAARWTLSLQDGRGFTNDLAWADYEVVPDFPPDVRLVYPSGTAYTLPTYGHLKVVYELRDDYGVASARLVLQPDGDAPWTSDLEPEPAGKGLWRITHDISLGEFMIGGARRVRIWLEVADGLPPHLGGPNVSRSRVIAVNLDNAERRSLADQVRVPERDALTNMLEAAAARLDEAARRLAAATNAPSETAFAEAVEAAETAAAEAGEKVEEAAKTASDGLFAGVANEIAALPEESLEAVHDAIAEVPLTEEQQREQAIRKLVEEMNRAAEETRAVVPEVLKADAVIEKAAALESLAAEEAREARKAQERQMTNDELDAWQTKQMELVNRFGALDEPVAAEPAPPTTAPPTIAQPTIAQPTPAAPEPARPAAAQPDGAAPEPTRPDGAALQAAHPAASEPARPAASEAAAAAERAAKAAKAAKEAPKDELLLKQARALQTAAGEGRRAAVEAKRAQETKAAIERDREPLAALAKAAGAVAKEAEKLADDALVVTFEAVKEAASGPSPEVREGLAVARAAEELAALADQAATRPGTVSPEKLAALADSLSAQAEKLAGGNDLQLKKAAEMAKRVAEAARAQAERADGHEGAATEAATPQREGRTPTAQPLGEQPEGPPAAAADEADAAMTKGDEGQQQADNSKGRPASAAARAAEAAREAAETAALSPREQAAAASSSAADAASAATNLAARLEAAIKPPAPAETPAAEAPATGAGSPAVEANSPPPTEAGHPGEETARESSLPATFELLRREAEQLAEEAREASLAAEAAERQAQKTGARNAQQAAQRAKRAADSARQSAEAVEAAAAKAAEAALAAEHSPLPAEAAADGPANEAANRQEPFAPPQEVTAKATEARRQADEAQRRAEENRQAAESLSAAPAEHAARAAEAAAKAAELAAELARGVAEKQQADDSKAGRQQADDSKAAQPGGPPSVAAAERQQADNSKAGQQQADNSKAGQQQADNSKVARPSPSTLEETRAALDRALEEARKEAQFAADMAGDARENLPADAAAAARQAADQAQEAARAFDTSRAEPAPGQQPPNQAALADRAQKAAQRAGELAEKAQRLADRAAAEPDEQVRPFRVARESAEDQLRDMAEILAASAAAIQSNLPISQTNAAAAAAVADARLAFDKAVGEATEIARGLNDPIAELPAVVANADRVAKEEKAALAAQGNPWEAEPPAAHAANEARETQRALESARRMANDLANAARGGSQNPGNAERVAKAALEKLPERAERAAAGDSRPSDADEPSAHRQGDDEGVVATSGPVGELARKLGDVREEMGNARNALAAGDADQARGVAHEAAVQAADVARAAAAVETDRQTQAGKSEKASAAASESAAKGAGQLLQSLATPPTEAAGAHPQLEASAPVIAGAASNVVAAAGQAADNPESARRLAEEALAVAKSLQAPSADQLEAARQANLASQELRRLAAETAASVGLDPETMKVKKPEGGKRGEKGDKKRKPAPTERGAGGNPNADQEPEAGEYEDGISLEMPEWLRRLGFPRSEWLKYGGSLESGLPESALEHVAPEYRALVREYFRYLSKEK